MWANEGFVASVDSFVNLQVLAPGKALVAGVAAEGLLAGVDAHVIDELVLCLEGSSEAGAVVPEAEVLAVWRFHHVLFHHMLDEFSHAGPLEIAFRAVFYPVARVARCLKEKRVRKMSVINIRLFNYFKKGLKNYF